MLFFLEQMKQQQIELNAQIKLNQRAVQKRLEQFKNKLIAGQVLVWTSGTIVFLLTLFYGERSDPWGATAAADGAADVFNQSQQVAYWVTSALIWVHVVLAAVMLTVFLLFEQRKIMANARWKRQRAFKQLKMKQVGTEKDKHRNSELVMLRVGYSGDVEAETNDSADSFSEPFLAPLPAVPGELGSQGSWGLTQLREKFYLFRQFVFSVSPYVLYFAFSLVGLEYSPFFFAGHFLFDVMRNPEGRNVSRTF